MSIKEKIILSIGIPLGFLIINFLNFYMILPRIDVIINRGSCVYSDNLQHAFTIFICINLTIIELCIAGGIYNWVIWMTKNEIKE